MGDIILQSHLPQQKFKCDICNRVYINKKILFRHLCKHEQPGVFSCSVCSKTFPTMTRLRIHNRIHSGERPFKCSYCQLNFASKFQLKLHQRRHTGEKPYCCTYCNKEFSSSSGLRQHIKTHTNESPYVCSQCNKSFKQKEKLKQHESIHSGIRPFMCEQCPKTFRIKNALTRHLRIHTGNTFKCELCPKEFSESYALKKHHRNIHDKLSSIKLSNKSSSKDQEQISNVQLSNDSPLNKSFRTLQNSKSCKLKVVMTMQKQRKLQNKGLYSNFKHKLKDCSSDPDFRKNVTEKLYLVKSHKDTPTLVDKNGWHIIPLPTRSNLMNAVTKTIQKCSSENLTEVSTSLVKGAQCDDLCMRQDMHPEFSPRAKHYEVSKQQDNLMRAASSDVITTGLHQMVTEEVNRQKNVKVPESVVCQQTEITPDASRRRREITHPSTIEYFPVTDKSLGSVYEQKRESFEFLQNSTHESTGFPNLQMPPYVSVVSELQETYLDNESFKDGGTFSGNLFSKPEYPHHQFQKLGHDQQRQLHHNPSFYQRVLNRPENILMEGNQIFPKATLHHHPEVCQKSYEHHPSRYIDIQQQYESRSVQENVDHQRCPWNQVSDHASFGNNMQPLHYKQASSDEVIGSQASFTQPILSSLSTCAVDCSHQPPSNTVSSIPAPHHPMGVKSSQQLPHFESVKSNQQYLNQNEAMQSNQQFLQQQTSVKLPQALFDHRDTLNSNQQARLFSKFNSTAGSSNLPNHLPLLSANVGQRAETVTFSNSSIIHHKPARVVSHDYGMDPCVNNETWPLYFQTQHPLSSPHLELIQSFTSNGKTIQIETSAHEAKQDAFASSQYDIVSHADTIQSFNLPITCLNVPHCNVSNDLCCDSGALKLSLPTIDDTPSDDNLITLKNSILQTSDSPVIDCLHILPTRSTECVNIDGGSDKFTVNSLPDKFSQISCQFVGVNIIEQMVKLQDLNKLQNLEESGISSIYKSEVGQKFLARLDSMSKLISGSLETMNDTESLCKNNTLDVCDEEFSGDEIEIESSDEVQSSLLEQNELKVKKIVTGSRQVIEKILEQSDKSKLEIRQRPRRTACFTKCRNASNSVMDCSPAPSQNKNLAASRTITSSCSGESERKDSMEAAYADLKHKESILQISKNKQTQFQNISEQNISSTQKQYLEQNISSVQIMDPEPHISLDTKISQKQSMNNFSQEVSGMFSGESELSGSICFNENRNGKQELRNRIKRNNLNTGKGENIKVDDIVDPNLVPSGGKNVFFDSKRVDSSSSSKEIKKIECDKIKIGLNQENKNIECGLDENTQKETNYLNNSNVNIKAQSKLRHECEICNKDFPNKSRLQRHMKTHTDKKPYPCSLCPQSFTAKKYLDNHMERHDKQPAIFVCGICRKIFPRRYQLKIHYRTHSGEKPYKCSHCDSCFATSFQVQLHERVHSDTRAYQCCYCGKSFRSNTNLALHVKRHTNNRPYLCATCGATFYEASKLKAHIRIHTGVHPFMCDQCPKIFKVKHLLVRHLRWHSGNLFKCEHCNKKCDEKWILRAHIQKHHVGMGSSSLPPFTSL